ncbi:MAG TPA: phage portal protein [Acidimicrobiales bacterium]|nr:phage portal protein [Acidimicrobiales bacterium]
MWLRRRREPVLPYATNAVPPTYTSVDDFIAHALRFPQNGWFEPLPYGEYVGTVDRCLQLNSQQLRSMPLSFKQQANTGRDQPRWVTDPDPAWYPNGIGDAVFAIVWSMYARGEAFLWVTGRLADGYPATWTVLDATTMRVEEQGGVRVYRSNSAPLDSRDVLHIFRNPTGALRGTGALQAYWANVASAAAADAYAADVYNSTGVNRVALKSSRRLDATQAADVQAQWVAAVSRRLGAPAIIPPDLDLMQSISVSPKDMMLLESRDWDARQIAAAFGVPAILLNLAVSGGLVYQNPAQLVDLWWRTELISVARAITDALSRWLPRGNWVEFDPSRALQPDVASKMTVAASAIDKGVMSTDEARAWVFDLPPADRGDQADELFEESGAAHGTPSLEGVLQ